MFQTKLVKCEKCGNKFKVKVGFRNECDNCGRSVEVKPKNLREANRVIKNLIQQQFDSWYSLCRVNGYLNSTEEQIRLNLPSTTYTTSISYSKKIIEEVIDLLKYW
jgi:hypothetical protein